MLHNLGWQHLGSERQAFDRLYYIELFRQLSERAVCPLILRLLFNMYRKQRILVRWGDSLSDMFSMSNGVKQGAVLSPVFFTAWLVLLTLALLIN